MKTHREHPALATLTYIPSKADATVQTTRICPNARNVTLPSPIGSTTSYLVACFSNFQSPLDSAAFRPNGLSFLRSFSACFRACFASLSFLALLSRAGFSRSTCRSLTRLSYIPAGSDVSASACWTYVGVKGASVVSLRR